MNNYNNNKDGLGKHRIANETKTSNTESNNDADEILTKTNEANNSKKAKPKENSAIDKEITTPTTTISAFTDINDIIIDYNIDPTTAAISDRIEHIRTILL